MDTTGPNISAWSNREGLLLARGPLEGSLNAARIYITRRLRGGRLTSMAFCQVILATGKGTHLFQPLGLQRRECSVSEVEWPASIRLAISDIIQPRVTMLFTLRSLSEAVTALSKHWGNQYFYAGRWQGVECSVGKSG